MLATARNTHLAVAITLNGKPKYKLAAEADMPANVLSGILSGRIIPSESAKARLAAVLGVTVADIFPDEVAV